MYNLFPVIFQACLHQQVNIRFLLVHLSLKFGILRGSFDIPSLFLRLTLLPFDKLRVTKIISVMVSRSNHACGASSLPPRYPVKE
jgi:hypothetical protein